MLDTQEIVYKEFFKLLFTSPDRNIDMLNLEDVLEYILEDNEIKSFNLPVRLRVLGD